MRRPGRRTRRGRTDRLNPSRATTAPGPVPKRFETPVSATAVAEVGGASTMVMMSRTVGSPAADRTWLRMVTSTRPVRSCFLVMVPTATRVVGRRLDRGGHRVVGERQVGPCRGDDLASTGALPADRRDLTRRIRLGLLAWVLLTKSLAWTWPSIRAFTTSGWAFRNALRTASTVVANFPPGHRVRSSTRTCPPAWTICVAYGSGSQPPSMEPVWKAVTAVELAWGRIETSPPPWVSVLNPWLLQPVAQGHVLGVAQLRGGQLGPLELGWRS